MNRKEKLLSLIDKYRQLGIDKQIDYDKFYLYSIITHSTAIEGSTITEVENQLLFDQGISATGKTIMEQMMNLDLKNAYEKSIQMADAHQDITVEALKTLSAILMKNTGTEYKTVLGDFSSAKGDFRLLNVTAGIGGRSYLNYAKVPEKLKAFCEDLNNQRSTLNRRDIAALYDLSFDAHYKLVTIHPWADGNGRMARLLMNHIQFEFCLVPTKVRKEDKEGYIKALIETREKDDLQIFRDFMTDMMIANLEYDIVAYIQSTDEKEGEKTSESREKKPKSREKIIAAIRENGHHTTKTLAGLLGLSTKAIEKHLAKLKAEGVIVRIGPDKGGHWETNE
ncbi:MAG: Fic family protein [Bacteroidales bacterium]|nr:Fic family protein [Bacteroidales bacterium]